MIALFTNFEVFHFRRSVVCFCWTSFVERSSFSGFDFDCSLLTFFPFDYFVVETIDRSINFVYEGDT